ncbi:MAG TPA: hypothetical protein VFF73_17155, partial [Planctomycetota bacterium]|nr:hypothetical protein [Planctomycetota bacterium]
TAVAPVATHTRADLVAAIVSLEARLGDPLAAERRADLERRSASVPDDVAGRAAIVLEAVPEALDALDAALAGFKPTDVPKEKWRALAYKKALDFGRDYAVDAATLELIATFDRAALVRGARALARAVDAAGLPLKGAHGAFSFEWETRAGTIALGGDADDVYERGPYLLVIDTGGDDTYRPRLPSNPEQYPIAISIDFAGNDLYAGDGLAFGTGVTGYGFLLDVAGDDRYIATDVGPGSGIFGVGVAIDRAGNDLHVVHRFGEGAGVFGIGILADIAGNDEYRCLQLAQGYGGTLGVGALVDASGDDLYMADDEHLECPSAQTKDHNVNLSQGCGFGRRAHPGDGHSFAGGLGVLVDGAGNDRYRCGVFGQGTGYWYSMGLLVDFAGDDDYRGAWYVQGSAAHFAVAALCDLAGNDHYVATMNQSQGAGHDGSIGILEDAAGDDVYECSGAGQGFGHWNGIGLLLDLGGQNRYTGSSQAFGMAEGADGGQIAAGIFVDLGKATFLSKPTPVATEGNLHQVRYVR